ncbi:MAG: hypothetical protein HC796_06560 [Synechococcaceae cyanobacterium RL_1_2]|nr:hypothetical protein [Synechococcaceae cyanobacterium RL_1_2]
MDCRQLKENLLAQICPSRLQGNPRTILVLDDDQTIYLLIQKLLASCHDLTVVRKDQTQDLTDFLTEVNQTLTLIITQGNRELGLVADYLERIAPNPCPRVILAVDRGQDLPQDFN